MTHDEEFAEFKRQIDDLFVAAFGLESIHFPDWDYYSCFDDGMTPADTFADWKAEYWPE